MLFSDLEGKLAHAGLRQEVPHQELGQSNFRRLIDSRLYTRQRESDLRLGIDWAAFYWAPADVFGSGKVLVFGEVIDKGGTPYSADIRGVLKGFAENLNQKKRLHPQRRQ